MKQTVLISLLGCMIWGAGLHGAKNLVATYKNSQFGYELQYAKLYKVTNKTRGGFTARRGEQEIITAAGQMSPDEDTVQLPELLRLWTPRSKLEKTSETWVHDTKTKQDRKGLIAYFEQCGEKPGHCIQLLTRDETLIYSVWLTGFTEDEALKILKSFKIIAGTKRLQK